MKIEFKKDIVGDSNMDNPNDVNLYIAGKFVASWNEQIVPEVLYKDKEVFSWVQTLMETAADVGIEHGAKNVRKSIKDALGL